MTDDERRVLRACQADLEIANIARFYFDAAQNYDMALSRERVTASQYYAGLPDPRGRWLRDVAASFDRLTGELGVKI